MCFLMVWFWLAALFSPREGLIQNERCCAVDYSSFINMKVISFQCGIGKYQHNFVG